MTTDYGISGLTLGSDGNLYGTIQTGGADSQGVVYRISLAGGYTVLHSFTGGGDGEYPGGRLVEGGDGNFYGLTAGTTEQTYEPSRRTAGVDPTPDAIIAPPPLPATVYRITPQGVLTSLYANSSSFNGLTLGGDGNFYSTDDAGVGQVFRLSIVSRPAFFAHQAPLTDGDVLSVVRQRQLFRLLPVPERPELSLPHRPRSRVFHRCQGRSGRFVPV